MIDLGEVDFDAKNFADHIVTWDGLIDIAKEHLGNIAYFKLPGVIHQCGRDYDTMFLVRMDDGRLDSGLIKMEDCGKPSFSVSEDIMKEFVKPIKKDGE